MAALGALIILVALILLFLIANEWGNAFQQFKVKKGR